MDDRSPQARTRTMAAIRSTNTSPEMRLRRALHARGVRYRLGQAVHAGGRKVKPDLVFKGRRLAVFVDGCFWHGCPEHCRRPNSNTDYWGPKLDRNLARDAATNAALAEAGWVVVRVWEHEDPATVADRVATLLAH
jgi:DNA mismatch endonuclease (patch repair protein)